MTDDRKCDLRDGCMCLEGPATTKAERDACPHFHMPCPPIVQSKQDRLRMTKQTWDKRRDRMMRAAEKKLGTVSDENEAKLHDIRRNPRKHLRSKGIKT
jgi:hypothetical protein